MGARTRRRPAAADRDLRLFFGGNRRAVPGRMRTAALDRARRVLEPKGRRPGSPERRSRVYLVQSVMCRRTGRNEIGAGPADRRDRRRLVRDAVRIRGNTMPAKVMKRGGKFAIVNSRSGKVYGTSKTKTAAQRSANVRNAIAHSNWKPTGKPARSTRRGK